MSKSTKSVVRKAETIEDDSFSLFSVSKKKKSKVTTENVKELSKEVIASVPSKTKGPAWLDVPTSPFTTFSDLGCAKWQVDILKRICITKPTEIQQKCIPSIMQGRDIVGRAKTGSGKTATFALPIQHKLAQDVFGIFALVLTPTRELAFQIEDQFRALGKPLDVTTCVVVGGMDMVQQVAQLSERPHIVIATPGRLSDLLVRGSLTFHANYLKFLVLDEADRLFEDCFQPYLDTILDYIPPAENRQTQMFSATITNPVQKGYAGGTKLLNNPVFIQVNSDDDNNVSTLDQSVLVLPNAVKETYLVYLLKKLISDDSQKSAIIFVKSCKGASFISGVLTHMEVPNVPLHSQVPQQKRMSNLEKFRSARVKVLVCTDVAARGLDIPQVAWVCNYDVPRTPEDYVHRVGRTARAGRGGAAVTFVSQYEVKDYQHIEKNAVHRELPALEVVEDEALEFIKEVTEAKKYVAVELKDMDLVTTRKTKLNKQD